MSHRFYIKQDLSEEQIIINDTNFCHQIIRVLKFKPPENIVLFNGDGQEVFAVIAEARPKQIIVKVTERQANQNEPKVKITLYISTIKRDNLEWVAQKVTEVGAFSIVPITTERTVKLGLNRTRLKTIIKEAAEQSGRAILPTLGEPINFAEALAEVRKFDVAVLFDKSGRLFPDLMPNVKFKSAAILIGPEGGFSSIEVQAVKTTGAIVASLGQLTLRAETAAVVASYLATHF